MITWIGSFCVKTNIFKGLKNPDRYAHLNFSQVDIIARLMKKGCKALIYSKEAQERITLSNKGGYSIPEVFGHNYLSIIKEIYNDGGISHQVYEKHKKHLLLKHINGYSFNQKETNFSRDGYFRYLLPFYWKNYYFYTSLIYLFVKNIFHCFFRVKKDKYQGIKKVKILCFKFKFKIKNKSKLIKFNCPKDKVSVGRYSYGVINALINENCSERLIIGDFCSIAPNVTFIVSSEHSYQSLSTYPFRVKICNFRAEAGSKGDIIVQDDVWIGFGAIICSGVTIGKGAIIAAGTVVTKDVPPYAIVGGNPAKIIKYRFSSAIIQKLMEFDFSKLTEEKIKKLQGKLYKRITEENVDQLLMEFNADVQ